MNVLDLLRRRRADRVADAATRYWRCVVMVADGDVRNDKAAAELAGELEELAPQLGFQTTDVEQHVALVRELRATTTAPDALENLQRKRKAIDDHMARDQQDWTRAWEEREARKRVESAELHQVIVQFDVLGKTKGRHAEVLAELTGLGMPAAVAKEDA